MSMYFGWLKSVAMGVGALALTGAVHAAAVGGFGSPRTLSGVGYSIYNAGSGANVELNTAANHVLYGDTITFAAPTTTATAAYLAGVDIFFTGLLNFNANQLSAAEVSALASFISGGGVVIAHGDNVAFSQTVDALLNVYGLDVNNVSNNGTGTVTPSNASHPVMNGPFGAVAAHVIRDSAYLASTSTGDGEVIAQYSGTGFGAIAVVNPGAGRLGGLLFLPDSETYGLRDLDFRNSAEARKLFNNGIAWAVDIADGTVPEPGTLALVGLALAGLAARSRRR